jgi:protease-4
LGLVDRLGNFNDAVDVAKEIAGIDGEVDLIYPKVYKLGVLDLLFQSAARSLHDSFVNAMGSRIEYKWGGGLSYSFK